MTPLGLRFIILLVFSVGGVDDCFPVFFEAVSKRAAVVNLAVGQNLEAGNLAPSAGVQMGKINVCV